MQGMDRSGVKEVEHELRDAKYESTASSLAEMLPYDALAKIFSHLALEDMLTVVPQVCWTWRHVSEDPICWQKVDLDKWSSLGRKPETVERMIKMLIARCQGSLREICAPYISNDNMRAIAVSNSPLRTLRVPYSHLTDDCVCKLTSSFSMITYLDISGCVSLSRASLESFGKNCRHIVRLDMNMHMPSSSMSYNDEMAFAIAQYMPQLRHLEMVYGTLSNAGLKVLLDRCMHLEFLDLRGCWHLNMEDAFVKDACDRFKVFYPPVVGNDIYNADESDLDASDLFDDDNSDVWYESDMDDLMIDMHEEEINGTLYFWPDTSPSRWRYV